MANIHSQKKRNQRSIRERNENFRYRSAVKTFFRRLEDSVEAGDAEAADEAHRHLVSRIDKGLKVGAFHRNTAARKKSRAARTRASLS